MDTSTQTASDTVSTPEAESQNTTAGSTNPPSDRRTAPALSHEQQKALHVLGYLFLRMGQHERAQRLFTALAAINPQDPWPQRNLAALALALGDNEAVLTHVRHVTDNRPLATAEAPLLLIKAKALWRLGRHQESQNALDAYLEVSGHTVKVER